MRTLSAPSTGHPVPSIPSGQAIRMQAIYYHPIAAHFLTFGFVASNEVVLTAL